MKEIENRVNYNGIKLINEFEINYDSYKKDKKFCNFAEKIIEEHFLNANEEKSNNFSCFIEYPENYITNEVENCFKDSSIHSSLDNEETLIILFPKAHFVEPKANINEFYIKNFGNICNIHPQKYCIFYNLKLKLSLCSLCINDTQSSEIIEKIDYIKSPEKIVDDIFYDFNKKFKILSEEIKKNIMNFSYKFKNKCNLFEFLVDIDTKICEKLSEYNKHYELSIKNIEIKVNETKEFMINDLKNFDHKYNIGKILEDEFIFLSLYDKIQKMNDEKYSFNVKIQNIIKKIEIFNDKKVKIYLEIEEFSEKISKKLQNLLNQFLPNFEEINKKSSIVLKSNNCYELLSNKFNTDFYIFQDNQLKKIYKKYNFYKFNVQFDNFFFELFNNAYLRKKILQKDKLDRIFVSFNKFKIFSSNHNKIISNKKINFTGFDKNHYKALVKDLRKNIIEIIDYSNEGYYLIFKISTYDGFCNEKYFLLPLKLFNSHYDRTIAKSIIKKILKDYPKIFYIPFEAKLNEIIEIFKL